MLPNLRIGGVTSFVGSGRVSYLVRIASTAFVIAAAFLVCASRAQATSFAITFDPSTASAPTDFFVPFDHELQLFQSTYTDPITSNLHVGRGDINGGALNPGNVG